MKGLDIYVRAFLFICVMPNKDYIETERLIMRRFTLDDAEAAFEMNADPEVIKFIPMETATNLEKVRVSIAKNTIADYEKYGFGRLAVTLKETGEFMGFSGLKNDLTIGGVDIGFRLKRKFWGQGYGTESVMPFIDVAFKQLKLKEIIGAAMKDNHGSVAILKKMGLTFTHSELFEGYPFDVYALKNPHL
ncbi:MAG: ribosomal-protein-alanine N-acetyltransferase [Arenicella sp.]|jgi:ribosomal-protein-alanine N-acetyltransferase